MYYTPFINWWSQKTINISRSTKPSTLIFWQLLNFIICFTKIFSTILIKRLSNKAADRTKWQSFVEKLGATGKVDDSDESTMEAEDYDCGTGSKGLEIDAQCIPKHFGLYYIILCNKHFLESFKFLLLYFQILKKKRGLRLPLLMILKKQVGEKTNSIFFLSKCSIDNFLKLFCFTNFFMINIIIVWPWNLKSLNT